MKKELIESIQESPGYLIAQLAKPESTEGRVREVLFYSGAKVERFDWWTGETYDLSFEVNGADLSALNAGAPVFYGHTSYTPDTVLGSVQKAWKGDKGHIAELKFSEAPDIESTWIKIDEGTLNAVSMGVSIQKLFLQEDDKKAKRKHYMATAWKPFEISVVPIGADPGARFLSMDPRLERLRANELSAQTGAASEAEQAAEAARHRLRLRASQFRVLGC